MSIQKCYLCNIKAIFTTVEAYYDFQGKLICNTCVDEIAHQVSTVVPVDIDQIITEINKEIPLEIGNYEQCEQHHQKLKLFCETCSNSACVFCVPSHNKHTFAQILAKANFLLKQFYMLEFSCKYLSTTSPENSQKVKKVAEDTIMFYYSLEGSGPNTIVTNASYKIEQGLALIKHSFPIYKDKTLEEIYNSFIEEKQPYVRIATPLLHWCQWNSKYVNFIYPNELAKSSVVLSEQKIPHFCRSIQLSPKKILACGGRDEPASFGLPRAFLIDIDTGEYEAIDQMHMGRANHALVYHLGYIYAIGGCDAGNKYTNTCERLDVQTLKWKNITATNEIRDSTSGVGMHADNSIYVFGSRRSNHVCSDTLEKYDISRTV